LKPKTTEEKDFLLLKNKIFKDTSLDCHQYKDNYLKRRIGVRMRAGGLETYEDYLRLLIYDPKEYEHLLRDITINVTQFFRDPEVFILLEEEILPLMIYDKVKNNRKIIRVWSAGCSSGEEAYSLAILLHDLLGEEKGNFICSIYGTDIDEKCLSQAREGRYLPRQVESVKPSYLSRYFHFDGEMYHVSDDIKDMVRYGSQDLFSEDKSGHFDVILCRNVLIYFTREMQGKLFTQFHNSLNDGGYLIIGKTETLIDQSGEMFTIWNATERIYQKKNSSIK
jgi:chemotaxis protein methyltransferase CheR